MKYLTCIKTRAEIWSHGLSNRSHFLWALCWWQSNKLKIGEALCPEQQSAISSTSKVEPPIGHRRRDSWQYDRFKTAGWALYFGPPTISIMSVLMYTEQPRLQGHGQGKHTCRKQTSDRIIKCHDWFSLLCARSVYCVGGVVPDCVGFCDELLLSWSESWAEVGALIRCICIDLVSYYCHVLLPEVFWFSLLDLLSYLHCTWKHYITQIATSENN